MHNAGGELPRIPLPRTSVNKGKREGPGRSCPGPSLVAVSDRAGILRSVYGGDVSANLVAALFAEEGAEVAADKVVARAAVEGADVGVDRVVALAAEEDVTRSERTGTSGIRTTETTEHVVTAGRLAEEIVGILGAADEGVVGGFEAGLQRPSRLRQALGISRTVYGGLGLGHPREGHGSRQYRG